MIFFLLYDILVLYMKLNSSGDENLKKITIITGHYGSGKTNFSVNLALKRAKLGEKVAAIDLDIVNPYFRLADFENLFAKNNIEFYAPAFANTNIDIPALNFDVEGMADFSDNLIIDVGGDNAGAVALGRYANVFSRPEMTLEMFYIVNRYRYVSDSESEVLELLPEIESASGLKATAIVNNSNLGNETDEETILSSLEWAEKIAKRADLPLLYNVYPSYIKTGIEKGFPVEIYVKPIWD